MIDVKLVANQKKILVKSNIYIWSSNQQPTPFWWGWL